MLTLLLIATLAQADDSRALVNFGTFSITGSAAALKGSPGEVFEVGNITLRGEGYVVLCAASGRQLSCVAGTRQGRHEDSIKLKSISGDQIVFDSGDGVSRKVKLQGAGAAFSGVSRDLSFFF